MIPHENTMKFPNDWILTTQEGFLELLLKKVDIFLSYYLFESCCVRQQLTMVSSLVNHGQTCNSSHRRPVMS